MFTPIAFAWMVLLSRAAAAADHELCGQYSVYSSPPYIFNNNAWNEDDSGSVCTYVSADPSTANNAWYSIWQWTSEPPTVRAYPHIELQSDALPLKLSSLYSLQVAASWSYSSNSSSTNDASNLQANVVLDVFGDADAETSRTPAAQKYEFMVWMASFGDAALPIGNDTPNNPPIVATVNGTNFTLYNGTNSNNQSVFSWLANTNLTSFNLDVAPLFGFLVYAKLVPEDTYLGTVQFGTETFFSNSAMDFSVQTFEANVRNTSGGAEPPSATQVPGPKKGDASLTRGNGCWWLASGLLMVLELFFCGG